MFHKANVILLFSLLLGWLACKSEKPVVKIKILNQSALSDLLKSHDGLLVMNIWATWCQPCREEMPELKKYVETISGSDHIRFVSISVDYPDEMNTTIRPYLRQANIDFEVFIQGLNSEQEFINFIDSSWSGALPTTFFWRNGKLLRRLDGKVTHGMLLQTGEELLNEADNVFY